MTLDLQVKEILSRGTSSSRLRRAGFQIDLLDEGTDISKEEMVARWRDNCRSLISLLVGSPSFVMEKMVHVMGCGGFAGVAVDQAFQH